MTEIVYGINLLKELIATNHNIAEIWVTGQVLAREPLIGSFIKNNNVKCNVVERKTIDGLTVGNHQGILARVDMFAYYTVNDILITAKERKENPFIVLLDGIVDPHNLGAIIRTADCAGVHGIVIPKNRSAGLNATVAKLSAGAIKYVKVARVTNLTETIRQLKKLGLWIIGCDTQTSLDYRSMEAKSSIGIVIGSEGKGISRLVKENCDFVVKLPMKGNITSLNASVAAGIVLYEALNQRCPL